MSIQLKRIRTLKIILIAALDENRVIGKDNGLIWHMPADLKRFKRLTMGHPIAMGRKTFDAIGGKPLPGRENHVLSRSRVFHLPHVHTYRSVEALLKVLEAEEKVYVIGGAQLFEEVMPLAQVLELTRIAGSFEGDTYFPPIDEAVWRCAWEEFHAKDAHNPYDFAFLRYLRRV